MGNPIYVTHNGDLLDTTMFRAEMLHLLLAKTPHLAQFCQLIGDTRDSNAPSITRPQLSNDDVAEAVAEGSAISATTTLTDGTCVVTPGRLAIKRKISDRLHFIFEEGYISPRKLAQYQADSVFLGHDAQITALYSSFTGSVGVSGADATLVDFLTAIQTLVRRECDPNNLVASLHPEQWNNIQTDLLSYGNIAVAREDVAKMLESEQKNFRGRLFKVEVWTSSQVADANGGADHGGAMFEKMTAIARGQGSAKPLPAGNGGRMLESGTVIYTNVVVDADKSDIDIVTNGFMGASVNEAGRGIKFITDHE